MLNDLRLAIRGLGRSPGFALVGILTLALGIGASTAIFSVVNGVLLRAPPYPDPASLMQIETVFDSGFAGRVSYPNFEDLRDENTSFSAMAAYAAWTSSATASGEAFRAVRADVSPGFFSTLNVVPELGRLFSPEEAETGGQVAVVSHDYWQNRLGGESRLTDRSVLVGGRQYAVIGVMPPGYDFPSGTELWLPRDPVFENRDSNNWDVVGRLRDGVSQTQAQEESNLISARLKQRYGNDTPMMHAAVQPVLERLVGDVRPALLVLLGAAGVLLLIACVNVANLLLARGLARDRESALRLALGARPTRLARHFLAESLVLSVSGAALGILLAYSGVPALLALEPGRLPGIQNVGVDWNVLAFSLIVSLLVALTIGLVPALRAGRRDIRDSLSGGLRIQGGGPAGSRLRSGFVMLQIAMTIVLIAGAGLLMRSFTNLLAVDPGFRTDGAVVMDLWFPEPCQYSSSGAICDAAAETRIVDFIDRLDARLRSLPGIEHSGGVNRFPLEGGGPNGAFIVQDRADEVSSIEDLVRLFDEPARTGDAEFRVASPEYFSSMGIPLISGRFFDARDSRDSPHVAVISDSLAGSRWPGEDPLGKLIQFAGMDGDFRPFTIVGVVGDVQEYGIGAAPRPTFYASYRQRPRNASSYHLAIQGSIGDPAIMESARRIANELDPLVPVAFDTVRAIVFASIGDRRFVLLLLGLFGGLALALATTGIYCAAAYVATQRTREIGVRMALGAQGGDVVRLLVQQGAVSALAGIAIGLVVALSLTRVLGSLLYDVGSSDPATFATAAAVLYIATVAASWIPAYRASSTIDPVEALRHD